MKLLTGLFLAAKRSLMTRDSGADEFKSKLDELVNRKDGLSEAEVSSRVAELEKLTDDIPDGDEKAKLTRFLEDFKAVKEQPPEVAKKAADGIFELYQSLCNEALKDSPESAAAPASGNPDNGGKVEDDETAAAAAKETQAPAGGNPDNGKPETPKPAAETKDADLAKGIENAGKAAGAALAAGTKVATSDADGAPLSEEQMEQVYQYIKKRMEQDAAGGTTDDDGKDSGGDGGKEPEKDTGVTDHAPRIPVNLPNSRQQYGGLGGLFKIAKGL